MHCGKLHNAKIFFRSSCARKFARNAEVPMKCGLLRHLLLRARRRRAYVERGARAVFERAISVAPMDSPRQNNFAPRG
jgi:hypothetical protein